MFRFLKKPAQAASQKLTTEVVEKAKNGAHLASALTLSGVVLATDNNRTTEHQTPQLRDGRPLGMPGL